MTIVVMSDSHNQHESFKVPRGDVFIHCGDALGRGTYAEAILFNEWLATLPHKHKLFVPGNHDKLFEDDPEAGRDVLTNATILIDEPITIDGKTFYGSPWTPLFYNWSFMKRDFDLYHIWDKIPPNLDVLITHGPPYGILDCNSRGYHCGSQTLHNAVIQKQPKFHVFGHIHESAGRLSFNNTKFINAAVLNGQYQIDAKPVVIKI